MEKKGFLLIGIVVALILALGINYGILQGGGENNQAEENQMGKEEIYSKTMEYISENRFVTEKNFSLKYTTVIPYDNSKSNILIELFPPKFRFSGNFVEIKENFEKSENNLAFTFQERWESQKNGENKLLGILLSGKAIKGKNSYYIYDPRYLENLVGENKLGPIIGENVEIRITEGEWKPTGYNPYLIELRNDIVRRACERMGPLRGYLKFIDNSKKYLTWNGKENQLEVEYLKGNVKFSLSVSFEEGNKISGFKAKVLEERTIDGSIFYSKFVVDYDVLNSNSIILSPL